MVNNTSLFIIIHIVFHVIQNKHNNKSMFCVCATGTNLSCLYVFQWGKYIRVKTRAKEQVCNPIIFENNFYVELQFCVFTMYTLKIRVF